jgi:hypothetical protein
MAEYVLGIKPVAAGCEKITFKPHLGKLNWVKGTYPTPKGIIKVELSRKADGTVETQIDLPEGVSIEE